MSMYYLGIDTSCYTTSCALLDSDGRLVKEERKLLTVKSGKRGLAQSEMVFQHTKALPALMKCLPHGISLGGVCVSAFPRREENSYMPAFMVGKGMGEALAHLSGCPLYYISHQENHILAALRERMEPIPDTPFMALHVSGGTTELLWCEPFSDYGLKTSIIGKSMDLHAGQFVDRIGVAMGSTFPAGPTMEIWAEQAETFLPLPVSVKKSDISFSGPASEAIRRIEKGQSNRASMAKAVMDCIGKSIIKMLNHAFENHFSTRLVIVGGVMANSKLRGMIEEYGYKRGLSLQFASPRYSSDNATGAAYGAYLFSRTM